MSLFRQVHTTFWNDVRVQEDFTPEDKYFYLYLLTNPHTKQIGVYQITKKQMSFEMGYSQESIQALIQRFKDHHKLIDYDDETREVSILNWGKYNLGRAGKPFEDLLKKELQGIKNVSLLLPIYEQVEQKNVKQIFEEFLILQGFYDSLTSRTTTGGQEKEKEKEKEEEKEYIPYVEILDCLNQATNSNYKSSTKKTKDLIKARFKEKFTLEDFKTVIDKKTSEWINHPEMSKYLRPETLFGTKFESYLNQKGGGSPGPNNQPPKDEFGLGF